MAQTFICALCAKNVSKNVYYCPEHRWHLCWDCLRKALLTTALKCPKCGHDVNRVD